VVACRACGTENPAGFKFCGACGIPLGDAAASVAASIAPEARPLPTTTEERRIVTALFCDLVGFTSASEAADPEDVDRMLSAYAAMARREIEYHGGVVEKFIGDAVVGVFGVPTAHEDDAERAVRAGLGICAQAADLQMAGGAPLRLRVGINTGEVLARLSVEPGSGERFLAGDPINTASRIQSAAPEMGVAVGSRTHDATKATIEYRALEPVSLKGKAEPLPIFEAIGSRSKTGVDLTRAQASQYIGRQDELARLRALFEETKDERTVRLVTVIADAGMGKSRIVAELRAHAKAGANRVTWHQGRCLPYGEGITFWALGEIVKTHAGILESDPPATATEKLDAVLPSSDQEAWLRERMLPLIGLESGTSVAREESFAAWLAFIQNMAAAGPLVLVVEDLHWADDSLLAFLEHVAAEGASHPILLLATARTELVAKHPDFAGSLANAERLFLQPLSTDDTAALVTSLIGAVVPDELAAPIIERADGNPLYAEEYVRLLRDRDLIVEADGAVTLRPGADLPLPESIHALLAARLDTLAADRKALLTDAAVVGKVFWDGALAAIGGRNRGEVGAGLAELADLGFLRRAAQSSMAGEQEYAFWHVLGRDVAYRQLPRGSRADRHAAAATWLEAKLGERVDDIADVLADHWGTALDLSKAAGREDQARQIEPKAIAFLVRAGERAMGLDTAAALARFEAAKELAGSDHERRPDILVRFAETAQHVRRGDEAIVALDEALQAFEARDDWRAKGRALLVKEHALLEAGSREPTRPVIEEAITLLEQHERTPALVDGLTERGVYQLYDLQLVEAIETFDRAMSIAKELGVPSPGRAVGFRGRARLTLGDAGGMEDFQESIALCVAAGQGRDIAINKINMGIWVWLYEGPAAGIVPVRAAIEDATRFGYGPLAMGMTLLSLQLLRDMGAYDEALEIYDRLNVPGSPEMRQTYGAQYRIHAVRGLREEALAGAEVWEEVARTTTNPEGRVTARGIAASIRGTCGDLEAACRLIEEALDLPELSQADEFISNHLPDLVRCACDAGKVELAERLLLDGGPRFPYAAHAQVTARALVAEQHGQFDDALAGFRDAAERWERFTIPSEEGHARLGEARCLIGLGRSQEALAPLAHSREIFERLGAPSLLAQIDASENEASQQSAASSG
jgi:class 3 adenylate cyclase/tetratricopeptide (TPR) repeat protein